MTFIQCFDDSTKDKLVALGYKFIKKDKVGNDIVYLFENNVKNQSFSNMKISFTNRMTF